jgi:hypothetical protein
VAEPGQPGKGNQGDGGNGGKAVVRQPAPAPGPPRPREDRPANTAAAEKPPARRAEADLPRDRERQYLYVTHMLLAQREWQEGQLLQALGPLEGQRPGPGDADRRGFRSGNVAS